VLLATTFYLSFLFKLRHHWELLTKREMG